MVFIPRTCFPDDLSHEYTKCKQVLLFACPNFLMRYKTLQSYIITKCFSSVATSGKTESDKTKLSLIMSFLTQP